MGFATQRSERVMKKEDLKTVLVTDCGSTTTKAVLFQKTEHGWQQVARGEAPTTVEKPIENVTVGARNAFREIQEITGRKILDDQKQAHEIPFLFTEKDPSKGIDLYLSTSSAGGGLQMIVTGTVKQMTTESAERAALGAGAIVLDSLSADDGREEYEKIERIRHLRPDIILLTGGIDGGATSHVVEAAEILVAASPRPRFGDTLKLPVIYAGNSDAQDEVQDILGEFAQFKAVENVRPTLEQENLKPARDAVHDFFLSHVMSHAPGYGTLLSWSPEPVMPTPGAVGEIIHSLATERELSVIAVDIGGATTDLFSVFPDQFSGEPVFNRTVSANLGMSYSVANVLIEAGADAISRWLPFELSKGEISDRLRNKMIRPTSIPQSLDDLYLEQAVCREALRLSLIHHRSLAVGLSGVARDKGISDIFSQTTNRAELVDMMKVDLLIGSGGVLSHAPDRAQAAMMLLDAFEPQGVTQLAVDSIFMMPHLGVFAKVHPQAASEILFRDCLINLATAVTPVYRAKKKKRQQLATVYLDGTQIGTIKPGEVTLFEENVGYEGEISIFPSDKDIDVGAGKGVEFVKKVKVGVVGIILDGRNRPIHFEEDVEKRIEKQKELFDAMALD